LAGLSDKRRLQEMAIAGALSSRFFSARPVRSVKRKKPKKMNS
jgi:hypothetical protein